MNRIRVFALGLLALCGLTALMAASASANWLEDGKEIHVNLKVVGQAHTTAELEVPSLKLEFRCTTVTPDDVLLLPLSTTALGKVNFSGCSAWSPEGLKGTEQKNCKPTEPIKAGGVALIKLLAKTKGGALKNYILFEPEPGEAFTTIVLPALCALAETSKVTGSTVAECGTLDAEKKFVSEDCNVERVQHLIQAGPTVWFESDGAGGHKEVIDDLKFGTNLAFVLGIASVELESGKPWCGHV